MKTSTKKEQTGYILLALAALLIISIVGASAPIEQNPAYHKFSDDREILNIPNFWNVISNLPFVIVGILGLYKLQKEDIVRKQFVFFFIGISLVAFGSAYYHWNPTNETLVWDRLPMTIGFMALFSALISEFIHLRMGRRILIPAMIIGFLSVVYWVAAKDLSIYLVVQFFPMLAAPVILIFFKSKYNMVMGYWLLLAAYVIAKIFEIYDHQTHDILGFISGHSLKHLFAALGIYMLILKRIDRELLN